MKTSNKFTSFAFFRNFAFTSNKVYVSATLFFVILSTFALLFDAYDTGVLNYDIFEALNTSPVQALLVLVSLASLSFGFRKYVVGFVILGLTTIAFFFKAPSFFVIPYSQNQYAFFDMNFLVLTIFIASFFLILRYSVALGFLVSSTQLIIFELALFELSQHGHGKWIIMGEHVTNYSFKIGISNLTNFDLLLVALLVFGVALPIYCFPRLRTMKLPTKLSLVALIAFVLMLAFIINQVPPDTSTNLHNIALSCLNKCPS